ncbi:hypothetical protein PtA15_1A397 [Puccinia triticina]|uniref:Uncharacterized protein n=1 Tax=Puccinia triticina TaxID=208348 RepID=A0ABY7C7D8_9BASI|nr:uncharacterized protein PtA15_1A397 [Puccinia triticina]WAQ81059.1 hypothetical protein PtA15_1A397 [Puccinia triticina]WAR51952.1 hypothetical protein PtB15_1B389 [Puccinia triticina]
MSIHRPTPATPQALLAYRPAYIHILYLYLQLRSRIIDCRQSLCVGTSLHASESSFTSSDNHPVQLIRPSNDHPIFGGS